MLHNCFDILMFPVKWRLVKWRLASDNSSMSIFFDLPLKVYPKNLLCSFVLLDWFCNLHMLFSLLVVGLENKGTIWCFGPFGEQMPWHTDAFWWYFACWSFIFLKVYEYGQMLWGSWNYIRMKRMPDIYYRKGQTHRAFKLLLLYLI